MDDKLRILIIEDNEVNRRSIYSNFINFGINKEQLTLVESQKAIDILKYGFYDCIFLDNCTSNIESLNLLKKLRSREISLPIIVLIKNGDEIITEELINAGATDYVRKSALTPEILDLVIRNAIRIYQIQAQLTVANHQVQENKQLLLSKNEKIEQQKEQIDLQNLKLIEILRLKSQFLATISHELRTPMNAIIGFSQFLLRPNCSTLSHQQRDIIERILNNGKNLLILINEILDFSKLQVGKLDLKPEIFDLSKLVNGTVAEMRSFAEAKKLSITVDINLQNTILYNDFLRVRQILINLLSNAIKFTDTGKIHIKITELAKNRVQLTVEDTGIGIAADKIPYIFEPFRQLDQGINRKFAGTGLGLPIVNALVNMMGGKITVESKLATGSLFHVELPRHVSSVLEKENTETSEICSSKKFVNNHKQIDFKREIQSKNEKE